MAPRCEKRRSRKSSMGAALGFADVPTDVVWEGSRVEALHAFPLFFDGEDDFALGRLEPLSLSCAGAGRSWG